VRLRDLGIVVGEHPPGPVNAITDVPGVTVGLRTVVADTPRVARTGVTVVLPRGGEEWTDPVFAGYHAFNGNGEITGIPWLLESGTLGSPVAITNTHQVGTIRDALVAHAEARDIATDFHLPVVTETYDGWLNDIAAFHLTAADLEAALAAAAGGDVAEGNVGGGTGMICHEFKGGTGTASRAAGGHTVGALVQANYGARRHLRVDGVAVGRAVGYDAVPAPWPDRRDGGSIVAVVATDAPLLPVQCTRLARRATVGLARVGGIGHNGSGDLFLAFATGNRLPGGAPGPDGLTMVPHPAMDPLFEAAAEAVEEAILNALVAAETMTGHDGRTAHALPHDALLTAMERG
jgi:D-aminopeptidase